MRRYGSRRRVFRSRSGVSASILALALLSWVLGSAGARGADEGKSRPRRWMTPGLRVQVIDLGNERLSLTSLWFETLEDLDDAGLGGRLYRFEALPVTPPFNSIKKLVLRNVREQWISSRARDLEFFRLGSIRRAAPPPPDWRRSFGGNSMWRRSAPAQPGVTVPYLNRAEYFWADSGGRLAQAEGEFLFRQRIVIDGPQHIARARLRLAGNANFLEVALNDQPLHLGTSAELGIAEFEVTPLVVQGTNLLAIRAQSRGAPLTQQPSIGFHLQITRVAIAPPEPRLSRISQAMIVSGESDRLWGRVEGMNESELNILTSYGPFTMRREVARGMLFPHGWLDEMPERKGPGWTGAIRGWFGKSKEPEPYPPAMGLPLRMRPIDLDSMVLLTDGRARRSQPRARQADRLVLVADNGEELSVPMRQVAAVYSPRSDGKVLIKPKGNVATLYCRVMTIHGEQFSGILRQINGKKVVLESSGGAFLTFSPDDLYEVRFPYRGLAAGEAAASSARGAPGESARPIGPAIGLLGRIGGGAGGHEDYIRLSAQVQEAAFLAGFACVVPRQDELGDSLQLNPRRYPVIVSVDPLGEYLDTIEEDGDARSALARYVSSGGVLVLYSRGGALRTAVVSAPGRFVRTIRKTGLASQLGLKTLHPGEGTTLGQKPFDRPPNQTEVVYFDRAQSLPAPLQILPTFVAVAPMLAAPFYPMVDPAGKFEAIYQLRDQAGHIYGPGFLIARRGAGMVIVIDHLLWHAEIDDQPFARAILPTVLSWAASPDRDSRR